jgi:hypothetical protein
MKANPRSIRRLLAASSVALAVSAFLPFFGHSDTSAKLRQEVQLGDPTDTDEGPAPAPPKGTTKVMSAGLSRGAERNSLLRDRVSVSLIARIYVLLALRARIP